MIGYVVGGICGAAIAGLGYQALGVRRDRKRFPPPGKCVPLEKHHLHIVDMGEGSPAVLLESGLMSTVLTWQGIQRELAKSTRTITTPRAGTLALNKPENPPRSFRFHRSRVLKEL